MPAVKEEVDVVAAGGAGHVVTIVSGMATLSEHVDIRRVGGASAGAGSAAGEALGLTPERMKKLMKKILQNDYLKDGSWNPLDRYGIHNGDNLHKELKGAFGDAKMKDAIIPLRIMVCDCWTRRPVVIDSENPEHAELLVADVVRASMAIPFFFKAWRLLSWRGNRLFVDGGTAANFALNMFDDVPERRTIGLRLQSAELGDYVKPVKSLRDFVEAIAALVLWASDNAYISKKHFANVILLPQIGNGLDFDLSDDLFEARWKAGREAVLESLHSMGLVR